MSMENLETAKTIAEVIKMCRDAAIALGVAAGVGSSGYYFWNKGNRIAAMEAAWKKAADTLTDLQRPGTPLSDYFPQYADECRIQLNHVISEADALQEEWNGDKRWIRKYIFSQRDYAERAKDKLERINELHQGIQSSSTEAYVLRARAHPLPREGEVLRPTSSPWPNRDTGAHTMLPAEHLVYRQTQQGFVMPASPTIGAHAWASQSSVNIQSPTSSTTSLLHGFGPTIPGIPPTGESFPYLAPQGRIPGTRSNTAPVPVVYAHFNQLSSTPYGHTAPTPATPYSPYGQSAYPPSVPYNSNGTEYASSGSRQ